MGNSENTDYTKEDLQYTRESGKDGTTHRVVLFEGVHWCVDCDVGERNDKGRTVFGDFVCAPDEKNWELDKTPEPHRRTKSGCLDCKQVIGGVSTCYPCITLEERSSRDAIRRRVLKLRADELDLEEQIDRLNKRLQMTVHQRKSAQLAVELGDLEAP